MVARVTARWHWSIVLAVSLIAVYTSAFVIFLLVQPGSHGLFTEIDNLAQIVGPLVLLPFCFGWLPPRTRLEKNTERQWTPILLGLGVCTDVLGQTIWTFYAQVLHEPLPFPSWADASYLMTYPLLLLAILRLPRERISLTSKMRITADGLIIMAAAFTFSWYFVLGPTALQANESPFARVVGTAYPLADLLLLACVLSLLLRNGSSPVRPVVGVLAAGLVSIIVADSLFDYGTLHNTYGTGELIDALWPLGDMLICLAAVVVRRVPAEAQTAPIEDEPSVPVARRSQTWLSLVPYFFVPPVGLLLLYTQHIHGDELYEPGVFIGCVVLTGFVLFRQILAIMENGELSSRLQRNNAALHEANRRLEALATTDPLTNLPNHRALVSALDHEMERARRFHRPCSLVFLDLDHFKSLNDSLGHSAGDGALSELGTVVSEALRSIDILGRWGGEEFVVLLPETGADEAVIAAERIRISVAAHPFASCQNMHLTCSLGVATYPHDAEELNELVHMADQAMYAAKRLGRNQVRSIGDAAVHALAAELDSTGSREEAALLGTVEALSALVDARDDYTGRHTYDVAKLSKRLAVALGFDAKEAHVIGLAARLHDIGKVAVPDSVLRKPGKLSQEEWAVMRTHPVVGSDVVSRVPALRVLAPIIRSHHERWDGRGYPDGLSAEESPIGARIVAVADAYEAMITDRPYRLRVSPHAALAELQRCAGTQFDPDLVTALARLLAPDLTSEDETRAQQYERRTSA